MPSARASPMLPPKFCPIRGGSPAHPHCCILNFAPTLLLSPHSDHRAGSERAILPSAVGDPSPHRAVVAVAGTRGGPFPTVTGPQRQP